MTSSDIRDPEVMSKQPRMPSEENGVILIEQMANQILQQMKDELQMKEIEVFAPEESNQCLATVYGTLDYMSASRLLVIIPYREAGIWSRSICLNGEEEQGSMMPYLRKAVKEKYGVIVMNPAANDKCSGYKHVELVWKNLVAPLSSKLFIIAYSRGCQYIHDLFNDDAGQGIVQERVISMALVEPSHQITDSDIYFTRRILAKRAMAWLLSAKVVVGHELEEAETKYGCVCLSAGPIAASVTGSSGGRALSCVMSSVFGMFAARCGKEAGITQKDDVRNVPCGICRRKLGFLNRKIACSWCEVIVCSHCSKPIEIPPFGLQRMCLVCQSLPCLINPAIVKAANQPESSGVNEVIIMQPHGDAVSLADFELVKAIGRGACGIVKLVRKNHGQDEGELYALKSIRKNLVHQKGLVEATNAERRILNQVKHPFISSLCYAFQNDSKLYLLTKYYPGGSLLDQMRKVSRFSEDRARLYAAEVALALSHLHQNGIMYRDLKLENVLCDSDGHVALTDFGMSKDNLQDGERARTFVGTYQMMAPEIIKGETYTHAVDWWALGVMTYEMIEGRTPFNGQNNAQIKSRILSCEMRYSVRFSRDAQDFVASLLKLNSENRLGCNELGFDAIKNHKWFASLNWDDVYQKKVLFKNQDLLMQSHAKKLSQDDILAAYLHSNKKVVDTPASVKSAIGSAFDDFGYNYMDDAPSSDDELAC